jgi:hypothetical protein
MGYHATVGRFAQRHPVPYPDGMSLYEYVSSNPAGLTDPMGLCQGAGAPQGPRHRPSASSRCGVLTRRPRWSVTRR